MHGLPATDQPLAYQPAIGEVITGLGAGSGKGVTGTYQASQPQLGTVTVRAPGGVRMYLAADTIRPVTREA